MTIANPQSRNHAPSQRAPFRQVAIYGKPGAPLAEPMAAIAQAVQSCGLTALFEAATLREAGLAGYTGHSHEAIGEQADVAIVLGGDGTMLGVARELASYNIPLIGINHGRLGFITDIAVDHITQALVPMLRGEYETDQRAMLDAQVRRADTTVLHTRALNDVVVARGVTGGMIEFTIRVDNITLYNQRADGVILATPTGSTAYALSAHGPIVHPSVGGLVLVPVAPHSLTQRPIVLPNHLTVDIEITDVRDGRAHFDMQTMSNLSPGDSVRVNVSKDVVTMLHPKGYNYYATLRQKLHWSVMPPEPHNRA